MEPESPARARRIIELDVAVADAELGLARQLNICAHSNQRAVDALEEHAHLQEMLEILLNPIAEHDAIVLRFQTFVDRIADEDRGLQIELDVARTRPPPLPTPQPSPPDAPPPRAPRNSRVLIHVHFHDGPDVVHTNICIGLRGISQPIQTRRMCMFCCPSGRLP